MRNSGVGGDVVLSASIRSTPIRACPGPSCNLARRIWRALIEVGTEELQQRGHVLPMRHRLEYVLLGLLFVGEKRIR